tara:strand:+ start:738 stop:845 length:108 start_codon:yes stop_codon:yes gene_type:complete
MKKINKPKIDKKMGSKLLASLDKTIIKLEKLKKEI